MAYRVNDPDMVWVRTSAGKCWGCDSLATDVPQMFVNNSNYRYCGTCRFDPTVFKRNDLDDDAASLDRFLSGQEFSS